MDLQMSLFKDKITADVNDSHLPPSVVFYILKDILKQVEEVSINAIRQQQEIPEQPEVEVKTDVVNEN